MPIENIATTEETLSHEGRGIAHPQGKALFIEGALPGETVRFQHIKRYQKYAEAKTLEVISAAPERVTPACEHFGVCGGCSLQHYHPAAQVVHKQRVLLEQLQHIGGMQPEIILSPLIAEPLGYRRKARLGVKYVEKKGRVLIGFREQNSHFLADLSSCPVLHPTIGTKLTVLGELLAKLSIYRAIPQIEIAVGDTTTALVIRHLQPLSEADSAHLCDFAQTHAFHLYLQPGNPTTCQLLWPKNADPYLSYQLLDNGLTLLFQPLDFVQVNSAINQQMVQRAIELLQPQAHENLLDLFCGLGNFTLPLAKHCQHITGIEGSDDMVQRAQMNARHNAITNAEFHCADLSKMPGAQPWINRTFAKIILDPPRSGALAIVQTIQRFAAKRILYISCNPATLARDSAELSRQGYRLQQAGIMDMFPHTSHVEAIALFVAS